MKCGQCKGRHATVADVRACYADAGRGGQQQPTVDVTPRQSGKNAEHWRTLPAGRYAVLNLDGAEPGRCRFFKVQDGKGKWKGYKFLSEQAGDDFHPVRNVQRREAVFNAILEDPENAMLMYGQEIGACGHCGRTLTDEASRARGIGPVCAEKVSF